MNHDRRNFLSLILGGDAREVEVPASPNDLGRRDLLTIFMWIVFALVGRWKIPAQLAPAADLVQRVVTDRAIFKGGTMRLSLIIKGFEVPEFDEHLRKQFAQHIAEGMMWEEEKTDDSIAAG